MKNINYLLFGIIFLMVILPMVSAQDVGENFGTFKQNSCVNLIQTCGNCTYVNASVFYPNSTTALSDISMTKSGTVYNYSFCSTSVVGTYNVVGSGNPDAVVTVWDYTFNVTPSGIEYTQSFFWLILALGFGMVIFGFWKEDYTITTLGSFALVFVGLYILFYGIADVKDVMSNGIAIVILGIAGYIMAKLGVDWVTEDYNALG